MLTVINAGHHPGSDPGSVGSSITEAELAKEYAYLVIKYLEAADESAIFVQDELEEVCDIANEKNADLFVSIHFNAFDNKAHGTETLYCEDSKNGKILASCIHNQLIDTLKLTNRGLKIDTLYVTAHTNMPSCLVEVGFLDNLEEEKILIEKKDDACRAIARGITDAINIIFNQ